MARFRLSRLARSDLARIFASSQERWGIEGRQRYAAMTAAAMRKVAGQPEGPTTRARPELAPGLRSVHLQYSQAGTLKVRVRRPRHIIYYRAMAPGLIEIVRVLHERMDPSRHLRVRFEDRD